jgi:hypothetical protein
MLDKRIKRKDQAPIQEQFPDLYDSIVEWERREIAEMAETQLPERETT